MPLWHSLSVEQSLALAGSTIDGLTDSDARLRLEQDGRNVLRRILPRPWWIVLADQVRGVFALLLISASALATAAGDWRDAIAITVVLLFNTLIGFFTELRARRAIEGLLALEVSTATVIRSGKPRRIDARDLVPGDIIVLESGSAVPADARLVTAVELRTNEATLSGESLPVDKIGNRSIEADNPLPERANMVYLGTTVVSGAGRALVIATGENTEVGRIGTLMQSIRAEHTPLERRLDSLGRQLAILAVSIGIVIAGISLWQGIRVTEVIRIAVAVTIAAVPEGLPAVVTVAMALGVHRMAKRHALVRRLATVEALGSTSVVCTDKTGTLTTGRMRVTHLWVSGRDIRVTGEGYDPIGDFIEGDQSISAGDDRDVAIALRIAALANRSHLNRAGENWEITGDPTEGALLTLASKAGIHRAVLLERWPEAGELPFSSERMLMATYHTSDGRLVAHVKGSPQPVLERCSHMLAQSGTAALDDKSRRELLDRNDLMSSKGLRVLALAHGHVRDTGERDLTDLTFIGFAGMIDAPAPGVGDTITTLGNAGVRVIMLTGDQRRTAEAIAQNLGIMQAGDESLDGRTVDELSDDELRARAEHTTAYSRVSPEGKVRIIAALQRRKEIVAMLGDGVNDAAALRKADVGVAMGIRGTDIAKEAAGIVLEDDRFGTIGAAVEEGRVIFDNIRKFIFYLLSCNLAEIIVLLAAGLAGLPGALIPLQILWLNLVTDTFPALALGFEKAEHDVMRRPPRDPAAALLSPSLFRRAVAFALAIAGCVFVAFIIGLSGDTGSSGRARTMAFMTIALAQTFHLGNARSRTEVVTPARALSNPLAILSVVLVLSLQFLTLYLKPLRDLLEVAPLTATDWITVVGLGIAPSVAGQSLKIYRRITARYIPRR
jgi:Ca2+-transporting ATPase